MAQDKIKFSTNGSNWVTIAQPDELGWAFETTYTSDSGRVQSGAAVTSAMFTVESFSLGYTFLSLAEAHTIASYIVKGKPIYVHYPSVYYNSWRSGLFYVGKGETKWGRINTSEELIENFQFNIVGVNPI